MIGNHGLNLLEGSDLTFDHCFRITQGFRIIMPDISFIIGPRGRKVRQSIENHGLQIFLMG